MNTAKNIDYICGMNKTSKYKFTVIVPFFNEKENISRVEEALSKYISKCPASPACVLFVNDGSTDGGDELVHQACQKHDDFYYIDLERNGGLSGALKAGIDNCFSPILGYIDADLQTNPFDFDKLLEKVDRYALVTGIRTERKDGFVKRASSVIANGWRRMMTHDGMSDTGCPLKVMQTSYAKKIPLFTGMHRFLPALVRMAGGECFQIPVRHYPRIAGKAKYNLLNRLWGPFIDCFAYRWMRSRFIDNKFTSDNL